MEIRRRALVVGASRGIGRATAIELSRRGYDVVLGFAKDRSRAEGVLSELDGNARSALVQGDIACEGARLVDEAAEILGGLEAVVVTPAPIITGRVAAVSAEDAQRAMEVVAFGFRDAVLAARPHMTASHGSVVAVSSPGAERYAKYYGALGPAKASLEAYVRYLAVELGRDNVRVNAVSPSLVDDPGHFEEAPEVTAFLAATAERTPLGRRLAQPQDVARVIASLLSDDFGYVTGQIVKVDGGYSLLL